MAGISTRVEAATSKGREIDLFAGGWFRLEQGVPVVARGRQHKDWAIADVMMSNPTYITEFIRTNVPAAA